VERSISDDGETNEIQKKGIIGIGPNYLPRSGLVQCLYYVCVCNDNN